jgi:5,10-methylenetetrahydrofolate reductase
VPTISIELVPATKTGGKETTLNEGRSVREKLDKAGILHDINTVMIPQVIPEDEYRPVELEEKLDPIDTKRYLSESLPVDYIPTQVTVYTPMEQLRQRAELLRNEGIQRVIFVGAPRVENERMVGPTPPEAISGLQDIIPSCGVILIPTRDSEVDRFSAKVDAGASFGNTQLLFSDYVTTFLGDLAQKTDKRPEIVLTFGYVPKAEAKVGLFEWMIWDDQPIVRDEIEFVQNIAEEPFKEKKSKLVDLYKQVIDGVHKYDFPIGIQFSIPYGISGPAFETFSEMLEVWSPQRQPVGAGYQGDD